MLARKASATVWLLVAVAADPGYDQQGYGQAGAGTVVIPVGLSTIEGRHPATISAVADAQSPHALDLLAKGMAEAQEGVVDQAMVNAAGASALLGESQQQLLHMEESALQESGRDKADAERQLSLEDHRLRSERERDHSEERRLRQRSLKRHREEDAQLDKLQDLEGDLEAEDEKLQAMEEDEAEHLKAEAAKGQAELLRQGAREKTAVTQALSAKKLKRLSDAVLQMPDGPGSMKEQVMECLDIEPGQDTAESKGAESEEHSIEIEAERELNHIDCIPEADLEKIREQLEQGPPPDS